MKADAIVNPTCSYPVIVGGTDFTINQCAGSELFAEREKIGHIEQTKAIITQGYYLPAKHVIHVATTSTSNEHTLSKKHLLESYTNVFELACKYQLSSIAMQLFTFDSSHVMENEAFELALSAIKSFLNQYDMMIYITIPNDLSISISKDKYSDLTKYLTDAENEPFIFYD